MSSAAAALGLSLSACTDPEPRSFLYFMDDKIAREGALVRCEADPLSAQTDIECANARRAEATIALRLERERREELESESERRIAELSRRITEREQLAREAALEAVKQDREAFDLLLRERLQLGAPEPTAATADEIALSESVGSDIIVFPDAEGSGATEDPDEVLRISRSSDPNP
jgi:hypothetical protein